MFPKQTPKWKIISASTGETICWWGKNALGKYAPREAAEAAAKDMKAAGQDVIAVPVEVGK